MLTASVTLILKQGYIATGSEGMLKTKLYDKRYDFSFRIMNLVFVCINIPAAHAYGVHFSYVQRYSRTFSFYQNFLDRGLLLINKLLYRRCKVAKLKLSLISFTATIMTWSSVMTYMCLRCPRICFSCRSHNPSFFLCQDLSPDFKQK